MSLCVRSAAQSMRLRKYGSPVKAAGRPRRRKTESPTEDPRRAAGAIIVPFLAVLAAQTWILASGRGDNPPSTVHGISYWIVQAIILAVALGITTQPLASIAKREEIIYLYGQEDDPIVLDRRSPVLHLVQRVRDESHRFAVGYHRKRREMRDRDSELLSIPGVGELTRNRLVQHFGSVRGVKEADVAALTAVVPRKTADAIHDFFHPAETPDAEPFQILNNGG